MLETIFCTMIAMTCLTGTVDFPADALAASEPVRKLTMFERINAERAHRLGVKVRPRTVAYPHRSDRKPVRLEQALETQAAADGQNGRTTTAHLFAAPHRHRVHLGRIRCESERNAAMRYYHRLNSITVAEELNMRRAVRNGHPVQKREPWMPHWRPRKRVTVRNLLESFELIQCVRPPHRVRKDAAPEEIERFRSAREAWLARRDGEARRFGGHRLPVAAPDTVIRTKVSAAR